MEQELPIEQLANLSLNQGQLGENLPLPDLTNYTPGLYPSSPFEMPAINSKDFFNANIPQFQEFKIVQQSPQIASPFPAILPLGQALPGPNQAYSPIPIQVTPKRGRGRPKGS